MPTISYRHEQMGCQRKCLHLTQSLNDKIVIVKVFEKGLKITKGESTVVIHKIKRTKRQATGDKIQPKNT